MKCKYCNGKAVIYVRRTRTPLCPSHLEEYLIKNVVKVFKHYRIDLSNKKILIALSGGKDSSTMASLMKKLSEVEDFEVVGLYIDLGIPKYSDYSLKAVEKLSRSLDLEVRTINLREALGFNISDTGFKRRTICSACGIIKRYLMNYAALVDGCQIIATGHTLDDITAYILKSYITQDLKSLVKLGVYNPPLNKLIPGKVKPLGYVSEKESLVYVLSSNYPFYHEECPYVSHETIEFQAKRFLNMVEAKHPGIKLYMLREYEKNRQLYEKLVEYPPLRRCKICGMPSQREVCSFCSIVKRITGSYDSVLKMWENNFLRII